VAVAHATAVLVVAWTGAVGAALATSAINFAGAIAMLGAALLLPEHAARRLRQWDRAALARAHAHTVAVERAGRAEDGSYRTMRGLRMDHLVAPLDCLMDGSSSSSSSSTGMAKRASCGETRVLM
jgi:hypothetical protein